MKFRPIENQREAFLVRVTCDVMGVSPAGYYAWRGRPEGPRKTANRAMLTEMGGSIWPSPVIWRAEDPRGIAHRGA